MTSIFPIGPIPENLRVVARPRARPPRPTILRRNEKIGDSSPPFGSRGRSGEPNPVTLLGQARV